MPEPYQPQPGEEIECRCVLPEQSCPACREAARQIYDVEVSDEQ